MRAGYVLTLSLLAATACNGGDLSLPPLPDGQIRVTTHTSGTMVDGRYTITACPDESPVDCHARPLADGDTIYFRRDSTQWLDITLGDVAANCSVPSGRSTVVKGGTLSVDVRFEVVCSDSSAVPDSGPATLRVTVHAGGVNVDRYFALEVCGPASLCVSRPAIDGEALDFSRVNRWWYRIALLGVAANCAVPGGTTRTVAPYGPSLVELTFQVQCALQPAPPSANRIRVAVSVTTSGEDVDGRYTVSICDEQADECPSRALLDGQRLETSVDRLGKYVTKLGDVAANCVVADGVWRRIPRTADSVEASYAVTCAAFRGAARSSSPNDVPRAQ